MVSQGLIDVLKWVTCSMLSKWNWRKLVVSAKKEIERASLPASKVSHTGPMLFIINLNLNIQKASMGCPARSALGSP